MAARAVFGEHGLAAVELGGVGRIGLAVRRVRQPVRLRGLEEEQRHIRRLLRGRAPIGRVLFGRGDRDRRDAFAADQGAEMQQPFLAEQADIEKDAVERAQRADGIRAVLEYARRKHRIRRLEQVGQHLGLREIVELLVVALAAGKLFLPLLGRLQPGAEAVDRVHGARIVDAVGRHERGVERTRLRGVEELVDKARLDVLRIPEKDPVDPEILRARI